MGKMGFVRVKKSWINFLLSVEVSDPLQISGLLLTASQGQQQEFLLSNKLIFGVAGNQSTQRKAV